MDTLLWTGARKVEKRSIDIPEIRSDEVLIKVSRTGVCGSDIHAYLDKHRFRRPPAILGHELVGSVESVGSEVTTVKVGDYVTVNPQVSCQACELCAAGYDNLCRNKTVPGTAGWIGTFVQYFPAAEKTVIKLPSDMPLGLGVLIEPIAVAVHAVKRITELKGQRVTVIGAGPIGYLTAIAARYYGASEITCVDVDPVALGAATASGFTVVNPRESSAAPANIVFLTAGYPQSVNDALASTLPHGKVVIVSMYEGDIPIDIYQTVFNEIDVLGSMTYVHQDFIDAVEVANANPEIGNIVSEAVSFEEVPKALADIIEGRRTALKTVIDPFL